MTYTNSLLWRILSYSRLVLCAAIIVVVILIITSCAPNNYRITTSWERAFWYGYNQCEDKPYSYSCVQLRRDIK